MAAQRDDGAGSGAGREASGRTILRRIRANRLALYIGGFVFAGTAALLALGFAFELPGGVMFLLGLAFGLGVATMVKTATRAHAEKGDSLGPREHLATLPFAVVEFAFMFGMVFGTGAFAWVMRAAFYLTFMTHIWLFVRIRRRSERPKDESDRT